MRTIQMKKMIWSIILVAVTIELHEYWVWFWWWRLALKQ